MSRTESSIVIRKLDRIIDEILEAYGISIFSFLGININVSSMIKTNMHKTPQTANYVYQQVKKIINE